MVKDLREQTGLPMMDCKKALTETGGDASAAVDLLRKRGAVAAENKAGRATAEGRVAVFMDREKGLAALAEILCETAPTSNNPMFAELVANLAKHAALAGEADAATIESEPFVDDTSKTVEEVLHEVVNRIRENMKIGRVARVSGRAGSYVHHDGRVAVLIAVEGDGGDDGLLADLCMHITAMKPAAIARNDVDSELVEREQAIVREQIIASGKPENLVDKIMIGKMNRWFSERVLEEQPFVKDDKQTVGKVLKAAGIKITAFTRLKVGEA